MRAYINNFSHDARAHWLLGLTHAHALMHHVCVYVPFDCIVESRDCERARALQIVFTQNSIYSLLRCTLMDFVMCSGGWCWWWWWWGCVVCASLTTAKGAAEQTHARTHAGLTLWPNKTFVESVRSLTRSLFLSVRTLIASLRLVFGCILLFSCSTLDASQRALHV